MIPSHAVAKPLNIGDKGNKRSIFIFVISGFWRKSVTQKRLLPCCLQTNSCFAEKPVA